ncbi:Reticulocalbin-2 [Lamellibrachia satsuma]|nr:Reticulocalbin-2 [Lamellibrachia satsuma]
MTAVIVTTKIPVTSTIKQVFVRCPTGSHQEGEAFSELSPEEAQRRLGVIVDKMDTNKDSFVSREEIAHWVMHSFYTLRLEETLQRLKKHDTNNDGLVTWAELLLVDHDYTPKQLAAEMKEKHTKSPTRQADFEIIKQHADKFREADHNNDKSLDRDEYHAMIYPMDSPVEHEREVVDTLKLYDKNNDGFITFEEYRGKDKNVTKEEETDMYQQFHHDYDSNRDGKIDRTEIKDWVMPGDKPAAESEADHLISETDMDNDKKLTKDEITKHHKLWVGSAATGHGTHLHDSGEL